MAQKRAAMSDLEDRLSALPDGVLQHVLGFLPARQVVRTSVLAQRWRHVWKSVRRLHITRPVDDYNGENDDSLCNFVNPLLLLRGHVILDEVKFEYDSDFREETNIWVRHALLCQAQVVIVDVLFAYQRITLEGPPLVSRNLRKLELTRVKLQGKFLDFASCPALEVLEMERCIIRTERISSQYLKILRIESSSFAGYKGRICISVPSLICLQLNNFDGRAPLLESMPSLETASVKCALWLWPDSCAKGDFGGSCGTCSNCRFDDDHKDRYVLLGGLSSAVNLKLTAHSTMFLFRRDLNWCPTFSKLKKLLLNDWCVAVDLGALVCILEHSPVLENLTLQLRKGPKRTRRVGRNNITVEKPAALSERLKTIKIECEEVDDRVVKLLKFLTQLGIEVTIKITKYSCNWR